MSEKCGRCGKSVYANDNPQRVNEKVYHGMCFKCKECGTKLTMRSVQGDEGEIYCANHKPADVPNQVIDSTMAAAMNAPDSKMSSIEFAKGEGGSSYSHIPDHIKQAKEHGSGFSGTRNI